MQVLVVDSGSTDRTVEFARGAGARVEERTWTDYVDARAYARGRVQTPWTLMIDADEALDDVLRDAIVAAAGTVDGYVLRRDTYFCGRRMRLWRHEPLVRLFRTARARLEAHPAAGGGAALHERWCVDGPLETLEGVLLHYSYPDLASYRVKYARYTAIEAAASRPSLPRALRESALLPLRAGKLLLGRGALLDGWRGVYVGLRSAAYPSVVAWKALGRR